MGISQIMGLTALLGIPFIIVLYMLKPKHQNREVASTYLWQQVFDEIESASTLHRLRKSILLLLEILAILLITAILAGVFFEKRWIKSASYFSFGWIDFYAVDGYKADTF